MTGLVPALVGLVVCGGHAQSQQVQTDGWIAAASREHLWWVVEGSDERSLCHHAVAKSGPYFRALTTLKSRPEAIAAWGNQVWLAFPSATASNHAFREVFTVRATYIAAMDLYAASPSDRLDALESLPGNGELAGFVGTENGPVAMILSSDQVGREKANPRLLQLRGSQWIDLELPKQVDSTCDDARLAVGPDGQSLILLAESNDGDNRMAVSTRDPRSFQWIESECAQDLREVAALSAAGNQVIVATEDRASGGLVINSLRPNSLLPISRVPKPSHGFLLAALGDDIALVEPATLTMSMIEPVSGEVSSRVTLVEEPIGHRLWQVGLLAVVLLASVLLIFLVRPTEPGAISLQKGDALAGLVPRFLSLVIDLVPGVLLMMLVFGKQPAELLIPPVLTANLGQAVPYAAIVLLSIVHETVTELACDTTLGKFLLGVRVVGVNGARPKRSAILLRNIVKLVVLLVPPLALIVFFNPHMQGMGDLVARTLVVHPDGSAEPQQRSDG